MAVLLAAADLAGARLDVQTAKAFGAQFGTTIHSFYGASETGGIAYDAGDTLKQEGHVGRPMPGVTVTLVHDEARPQGAAASSSAARRSLPAISTRRTSRRILSWMADS